MAIRARDLELRTLTVEQEDRVLTVRFCDPPYNYMTARMQKTLNTLTAAVDADVSVVRSSSRRRTDALHHSLRYRRDSRRRSACRGR